MVCTEVHGDEQLIIATPNRSATWKANQLLLLALAAWLGLVATAFAMLGAWMILPFAGLELAALAVALYTVSRRLSQRHVLRVGQDVLVIEKGSHLPRQVWRFPRAQASLSVDLRNHPLDPPEIVICGPQHNVPVGDFLNFDDRQQLLVLLRDLGLRVRNYSTPGQITL